MHEVVVLSRHKLKHRHRLQLKGVGFLSSFLSPWFPKALDIAHAIPFVQLVLVRTSRALDVRKRILLMKKKGLLFDM